MTDLFEWDDGVERSGLKRIKEAGGHPEIAQQLRDWERLTPEPTDPAAV